MMSVAVCAIATTPRAGHRPRRVHQSLVVALILYGREGPVHRRRHRRVQQPSRCRRTHGHECRRVVGHPSGAFGGLCLRDGQSCCCCWSWCYCRGRWRRPHRRRGTRPRSWGRVPRDRARVQSRTLQTGNREARLDGTQVGEACRMGFARGAGREVAVEGGNGISAIRRRWLVKVAILRRIAMVLFGRT